MKASNMPIKKILSIAGLAGIAALLSLSFNILTASANTSPSLNGDISISGNTITISGSYTAGIGTVATICGGVHAIEVPLPEGGSTGNFTYSTNTGLSGEVPYTVTKAATTQTCGGASGSGASGYGNPEIGTFSVSFSDDTTSVHQVTISYSDNLGDPVQTQTFSYGSVPSQPPSGSTGTITVTSENANDQSVSVPAEWDLTGNVPGGLVCSASNGILWENTIPCSGTNEVYPNLPANYDIYGLYNPRAITPYYSFNSFEQVPIAENKKINSLRGQFALSLKNIFSTVAEAAEISPSGSYSLLPSQPSGAFFILWNPLVADMQVSPTNASFTPSSSMSQAETITATGAPSANLDWAASASTASGGNWLSVSPSDGTASIGNSGSGTGAATISADANGLPNGIYQGTVTFVGKGKGQNDRVVATITVSVTLTVTGSSILPHGSGYDCESNNQCVVTATNPQYASLSSCSTACVSPPPPPPTPTYSCINNACSQISSGGVSASSCAAACGEQQFACVDKACAQVSSGGTTLPTCQASCPGIIIDGGPGYACVNNACKTVPSGGVSYTSCEDACGTPPPPQSAGYACVNNACVSVPSGGTSLPNCQAACDVGGGGVGAGTGYSCVNNACVSVSSGGTSLPDCKAACGPPACTPGVNCPVCSPPLTANLASIVVPESSNLSYSCKNVTECQLVRDDTGQILQDIGAGASDTIDTTANPYAVTPSATTAYTLACINSDYAKNADNQATSNATVTVSGSTYCEQNPNGVGCQ